MRLLLAVLAIAVMGGFVALPQGPAPVESAGFYSTSPSPVDSDQVPARVAAR